MNMTKIYLDTYKTRICLLMTSKCNLVLSRDPWDNALPTELTWECWFGD